MGARRSEASRLDSSIADFARNGSGRNIEESGQLVYATVSNATPIGGTWGRWTYECIEAWVLTGPTYFTGGRSNGRTFPVCLSVSENGNGLPPTFISYGVNSANLLGSFVPQQIPVGTPVVLTPHRMANGSLIWLIINTQAIDGTCTGNGGGSNLPIHPIGGGGGGG
jgi:hypothetical protein